MEIEDCNLGSLKICEMVKISQSQNGLRHQDYARYHKYCTHRIKRIQKQMKFSYGKKYVNKDIRIECRNQPQMLQVLLYNSERAWAHAMQLKQDLLSDKGQLNRRTKFFIQKKFAKATKWANSLKEQMIDRTEKISEFEADAYYEYMQAQNDFERENWNKSLNHLIKTRQIYQELQKHSDQMQVAIYQEKIETIEQSIRFCNHKLQKGLQSTSIDDILQLKAKTLDPSLQQKFDQLMEDNRKNDKATSEFVTFQNEQLPIKNEKLINILQKIKQNENNIQQIKVENNNIEPLINIYGEIFGLFDEAIKINLKEKDDNKDSELLQKIFLKIQTYFQQEKQKQIVKRNHLQLNNAIEQFDQNQSLDYLEQLKIRKQKQVTPWEIIKWCDNLIHAQNQLLEGIDNIQGLYYRCLRIFYVSCLYYQHQKYKESYSLSQFNIQLMGIKQGNQWDKIKDDQQKIMRKNVVQLYQQNNQETVNLETKIKDMTIEDKNKQVKTLHSLLDSDNLESYQKIYEIIPQLQMASNKPMFFDIAQQNLQFPNLQEKLKRQSLFGKAFSFFKK